MEETVTEVPFNPALATAKENFLFTVIPSTFTGIVASQESEIVLVVVKVIVGLAVPLLATVAEIPGGQVISLATTVTAVH